MLLSWSLWIWFLFLAWDLSLTRSRKVSAVCLSLSHSTGYQQAPPPTPVARQIPLLLGHNCFFPASRRGTNARWPPQQSTHLATRLTKQISPKHLFTYTWTPAQCGAVPNGGRGGKPRAGRDGGDQSSWGWWSDSLLESFLGDGH